MPRPPRLPLIALAKLPDCLPERFFHLKPLGFEEAEDPCHEGTIEIVYITLINRYQLMIIS